MRKNDQSRNFSSVLLPALVCFTIATSHLHAQSVCLPAPRLLTTMPMGGTAGTTVDVTIKGDHFEELGELSFSHPGITAVPKTGDDGLPLDGQYVVTIGANVPAGIHEARVMTRLGISSSRVFNVSKSPEVSQSAGTNTALDKAMALDLNSICNAAVTAKSVDFYRFEAKKGQRIVIDCAAKGIDSKLTPVLIVADQDGNDLQVERRGGVVDFVAPQDGSFVVKVHDLTFNGGPYYFYRLALQTATPDQIIPRLPKTEAVSAASWPPHGLSPEAAVAEAEPNSEHKTAQKIQLPCDISGSFFPAADVDVFEFEAKQGDVWWVEIASERLGRPTDPTCVVQHVARTDAGETLTDVAEFSDIASPIKVSTNHYSYDGPPYNAGSTDFLGKLEIKQDGTHRLSVSDLFGGTRRDPNNVYRLIIRRPQPDFAVVGWALHMNLRNGDRNALSKPIALRPGSTMPFEIVAVRRDGFDGEIRLEMTDLPEGVTATGVNIPAGKTVGTLLITASSDAPRGLSTAKLTARAEIDGSETVREGRLASMAWPVPNHWSEIPAPRLLADIPVSVNGTEPAPITIAAADSVYEVEEGGSLTIPLQQSIRSEFSGATISLKTFGSGGFSSNAAFDSSLTKDASEAVLDLTKLKVQPGEYTVAFYGSAVAKYRYNPQAVEVAQAALDLAKQELEKATEQAATLTESAATASADEQAALKQRAAEAAQQKAQAEAAVKAAEKSLQQATKAAAPKDIVDIVVSEPFTVRVTPKTEAAQ